jgi:tetratricopeptide (TPR) repeat protein
MKTLLLLLLTFCAGGFFFSVEAQSPEDAAKGQLLFNAGNELVAKRNFNEAVEKFTSAIEVLPNWHLPYLNRGVAHLSLMNLVQAESDADRALSLIRPGIVSGENQAGIAFQIKGTIKQHQGDLEAALQHFSSAIEKVPNDAKFRNSRGNVYRPMNRYQDAFAEYSKAIELDPKMAMFYVNRSAINEALSNSENALADIDAALRIDPKLSSAYYTRANLRLKTKSYAEALADFDEAIRLDPNRSIFFHARGLAYTHSKKYDLAIKDQSQAIALDPKNGFAYSDRAVAHGYAGNNAAAISDVRSAISLNAGSAALRYNLGIFLFRAGKYAEAADAATQAIELAPNWDSAYVLRSNAFVKLGATAKAKADRDKAASLGTGGRPSNDPHTTFDLQIFVQEEPKQ